MTSSPAIVLVLDGISLRASIRLDDGWQQAASVACDGTPTAVRTAIESLNLPRNAAATAILARPLAQSLELTFPGTQRPELERMLERDWPRYLVGARHTPHVAAAEQIVGQRWRGAFVPADTAEAISSVAKEHAWSALTLTTMDDALAAASDGAPAAAVSIAGITHIVALHGGKPMLGRRLRDAGSQNVQAFLRSAMLPESATVRMVSEATLCDRASSAGMRLLVLPTSFARVATAESGRRLTRFFLVGAAAMLVLALGIERVSNARALDEVNRARAAIAPRVAASMSRRSSLMQLIDMTSALSSHEAHASQTSAIMAAIANALPQGTTISTLGVVRDSVIVEGESKRSNEVYDALRSLPQLDRVSLASPLRQDNEVATSHFAFAARVRSTPAAK